MLAISFVISLLACEIRLFAASRSVPVALHALCQQMGQSLGGALTWSPPHPMQLQMPYDFTEVPMNSSYYPGSGNYRIKCESAEEAMGMLEAEPDKYVGVYNA